MTAVAGAGAGPPTGIVTFEDGSTSLGTSLLNSSSVAMFPTNALSAGTHTIIGVYSGDTNFSTSSGTLNGGQTVTPAGTTTAVTSSPNPPLLFGQTVTFTATLTALSGTFDNGGTVQFAVDGSNFGTPVSLSGGSATIADATLSGGTHTITASYSGDNSFSSSTGTLPGGLTITQTVGSVTTYTGVSSSPATAVFGQSVMFTATVTATNFDDGGTVQFWVDGNTTGSAVSLNSSGQATISVSTLSAGMHTITASYSGDTDLQHQ